MEVPTRDNRGTETETEAEAKIAQRHRATRGDPGRARVSRAVAREPYMVLLGRPVSIQVKRRAWLFFSVSRKFWGSPLYALWHSSQV